MISSYNPVFENYESGILDSDECGTDTDHIVTIVGYGNDGHRNFYIVRNSWSTKWGESGYARISAVENGKGICGI